MSKIKLHTNTLKVRNKQGQIVDVPVLAGRSALMTYATKSDFPLVGEKGVIYVDDSVNDSSSLWRWNGIAYVPLMREPKLTAETHGDELELKLIYSE